MVGIFSKLFGKGSSSSGKSPEGAIQKVIDGIIDRGGFSLRYEIDSKEGELLVNFSGEDSRLLTEKEGLLLDSVQTFLKRMLQNRFPTERIEISIDSDGFLEMSANQLRELAEKLKKLVLEKGQPSYVRALPPRDRKIVHRYLAEDERIKSQSVGEGFCKKIKIFPARTTPMRSNGPSFNEASK